MTRERIMGGSEYIGKEVEGVVPEGAVMAEDPCTCSGVSMCKEEPNPKDKDRTEITEAEGIHKAWYVEARNIRTKEEFCTFIDKLDLKYKHDYGTIVHAVSAAALAGAWVMEQTDQGGITGFQAGGVMWEFIKHWIHQEGPLRLLEYEKMLYPQDQERFEKTLDQDTADWLKAEAQKKLGEDHAEGVHPEVLAHWQKLAAGELPWGYTVKMEKESPKPEEKPDMREKFPKKSEPGRKLAEIKINVNFLDYIESPVGETLMEELNMFIESLGERYTVRVSPTITTTDMTNQKVIMISEK
jgi:hypothetical protein